MGHLLAVAGEIDGGLGFMLIDRKANTSRVVNLTLESPELFPASQYDNVLSLLVWNSKNRVSLGTELGRFLEYDIDSKKILEKNRQGDSFIALVHNTDDSVRTRLTYLKGYVETRDAGMFFSDCGGYYYTDTNRIAVLFGSAGDGQFSIKTLSSQPVVSVDTGQRINGFKIGPQGKKIAIFLHGRGLLVLSTDPAVEALNLCRIVAPYQDANPNLKSLCQQLSRPGN